MSERHQWTNLSRRQMLKLSLWATTAAMLSACVAPGASTAGDGSGTTSAKTSIQANFAFDSPDAAPTIGEWIAKFGEANPDIEVVEVYTAWPDHHTKLLTQAAAGTLPDFMEIYGGYASQWIRQGSFLGLNDYTAKDADFDMADFFASIVEMYQGEGEIYALPYDHGPEILAYNKVLFDAASLPYPDDTWDMAKLLEVGQALTTEGETWGFGSLPRGWRTEGEFLMPWGGQLLNEDETECLIDGPAALEALQYWADMRLVHGVQPSASQAEMLQGLGGGFQSGKVAMTDAAPWSAPGFNQNPEVKWDVAPWPKGPATRVTAGQGSGFAITKDTKSTEASWKLLRWFESKEGLDFVWAGSGASTPPRRSIFSTYLNAPGVPEHAQYFY
ncbi:MAG TPA: sugar ABC transporter substrate-binding protein, partial [Caldilineaceae bacterium]|nr:sugar ABC transporter substrate-binding protein [Caldilineaceae bacterium]